MSDAFLHASAYLLHIWWTIASRVWGGCWPLTLQQGDHWTPFHFDHLPKIETANVNIGVKLLMCGPGGQNKDVSMTSIAGCLCCRPNKLTLTLKQKNSFFRRTIRMNYDSSPGSYRLFFVTKPQRGATFRRTVLPLTFDASVIFISLYRQISLPQKLLSNTKAIEQRWV